MANDSIGTARVDIVIDLAQYDLAIKRAKNAATGFGDEAEKAFDGQNAAAKRASKALLDYAANLGRTREETRLLRAAGQGVDPKIIEAATAAINEYRRGVAAAEDSANALGAAMQAASSVNAQFDALARQISTFAMGADELRRFDAAASGAGATLNPLISQLEALEAEARSVAAAMQQASSINVRFDSLQKQIETFGMGADQIRRYEASLLGVDSTLGPLIAKLEGLDAEARSLAAAMQDASAVNVRFDGLQKQIETFGMSADAIRRYETSLLGADATLLPLISKLEALEAEARSVAAAMDSATAINGMVDGLQRQIDTFGLSAEAMRRYEASLLGADSVIMPLVQKLEALENEARQVNEAFSMNAGVDKFIADLRREESQIGKTKAEIMELRAAELGISQQAAPLIASYKAKEAALGRYNTQLDASKRKLNEYGLSQKQLEFAMRGVPAQITDIFVSLQGGQAPLTVLLQQGGQLKDMFGGIRPAAAALGSQLLKLVNIWSVSAVAVSALAIAAYKGSQESNQFAKALALTGNAAGVTANQMAAIAAQIDSNSRSTQASASRALAAVASTGVIAKQNFEIIATAADEMQRATGKSIDDTVQEFVKLAKDPVEAIYKLNEGQNFLTASTYQQIKSLQEQGRTQEAATVATNAYAEATIAAARGVQENLGYLESAWKYLKIGASEAWDAMMGAGRSVDAAQRLQKAMLENQRDLNALQRARDPNSGFVLTDTQQKQLETRILAGYDKVKAINQEMSAEALEADKKRAANNANAMAIEQDRLITSQQSKAEQRKKALAAETLRTDKAIADAQFAGQTKLAEDLERNRAAALAAIEKKYADPKTGSKRGNNDAQRAALQAFKDEAEQTNAVIQQNAKNTQQSFQNNTVAASEYYSKMRQYVAEELAANERSLQGQIAYLRASKDSINNRREIGKLEADLAQVRARAAGEQQRISEEESTFNKKRKEEMEDYANSLRAVELAQQRNYAAQAASIGQGTIEAAKTAEITKLYTDQADKLYQLAILRDRDPINAGKYAEQEALLRASTERQVQNVEDGYTRMDDARGSWMNGYTRAFSNYNDDMRNIAGQTESFFGQVTGGVEGMLTDLAITGRTTMTTLTNAIIKDLIRLGTQKMLVWLMSSFGGGASAGASSGTMANFGNNPGWTANALGGVYSSPSLSAYSGQIHNTPQPFMFAKGAGIFGEAGPEAIMPLTRGSNGKLGVQASGAGGPGEVTVNIYGAPSEPEVKQTQNADGSASIDVLFGQFDSYLAQGIASGTSRTGLAMKGRYQLKENA